MLAFQIFINGRKVSVAGAEDLGVLSAIVSAIGKLGKNASNRKKNRKDFNVWLTVGGLACRKKKSQDEYLQWVKQKKIKIGDRIEIRVCKTNKAEPFIANNPKSLEQQEWYQYKTAKSQYFKLRKKFEKKKIKKSSI